MAATVNPDRPLSKNDIAALWFFLVAGAVLIGLSVYFAVGRIATAFAPGVVGVAGNFSGTPAQAPIGPDGAMRTVELDRAILLTDQLSAAGRTAIVIEEVIAIVMLMTLIGCLIALAVSVMRGRVFSRRNTVLVTIASVAALAGMFLVPFFGNMVANDAFRAISDGTFNNVNLRVELSDLFLAAFVAAIATTVFSLGDRLQREVSGLV